MLSRGWLSGLCPLSTVSRALHPAGIPHGICAAESKRREMPARPDLCPAPPAPTSMRVHTHPGSTGLAQFGVGPRGTLENFHTSVPQTRPRVVPGTQHPGWVQPRQTQWTEQAPGGGVTGRDPGDSRALCPSSRAPPARPPVRQPQSTLCGDLVSSQCGGLRMVPTKMEKKQPRKTGHRGDRGLGEASPST